MLDVEEKQEHYDDLLERKQDIEIAFASGNFYRVIGNRIKDTRLVIGLRQNELAALIGLSPSSVANIESGKRRVTLCHLSKIARACDVALSELLQGIP